MPMPKTLPSQKPPGWCQRSDDETLRRRWAGAAWTADRASTRAPRWYVVAGLDLALGDLCADLHGFAEPQVPVVWHIEIPRMVDAAIISVAVISAVQDLDPVRQTKGSER